jgi:D-glycero-D-manno-heptose 1,7-bisphosphate phosphatase
MIKLIVLDRDGVINEDSPSYIKTPDEWHPIAGSLEAIAKLKRHGYKIAIATNQSGIARHYYTKETLDLIHQKMLKQIETAGGHIDAIFICPHEPKDNCDCRKPKPGLLLQAAHQFNVKPEEILFIGDAMRDLLAAKACGATAILVKTGKGSEVLKTEKVEVPIYNDLADAVESIITKN